MCVRMYIRMQAHRSVCTLDSCKMLQRSSSWLAGYIPTVKTSLQTLLRRKATGGKGPATELEPGTYTLLQSFSHELSVPVAIPSSTIALCTGHRCAAIQRPLEDLRLKAGTVCDCNGLSGLHFYCSAHIGATREIMQLMRHSYLPQLKWC